MNCRSPLVVILVATAAVFGLRHGVFAADACVFPNEKVFSASCESKGWIDTKLGCGVAGDPVDKGSGCVCCQNPTPTTGGATGGDATDALTCASAGGYCLTSLVITTCPAGETVGGRCGVPLCCIKPATPATATGTSSTPKMIVGSSSKISNPLGSNVDFLVLLSRVVSAFLGMVGAISLLVFFTAGVRYMTAAGEEKAITQAKDTMKYAFLGLFFIIFAYVIANFFFQALVRGPGTS